MINGEDNFIDVAQLAGAVYSARAVCLIKRPKGEKRGTGFLIGPDLLLTNNHVLPSEKHIANAAAVFDYTNDLNGVETAGREFSFTEFLSGSPPEKLDYSLVRLAERPFPGLIKEDIETGTSLLDLFRRGKHRGYLLLAPLFIQESQRVNIIQHPRGQPSKVVLTRNYVPADMTEERVQYLADTMEGSSGSPVFNVHWEVVALHHSGKPYPAESVADKAKKAWKGVFRVNEGIPIAAILNDLKSKELAGLLPVN